MGNCLSAPEEDRSAKETSDAIDKMLEEDAKKWRKECKILLLGSGESGKSTILKQMKIIHQSGYSTEELLEYKPVVYRNLIECAQDLVRGAVKCSESFEEYGNRAFAEKILEYRIPSLTAFAHLTTQRANPVPGTSSPYSSMRSRRAAEDISITDFMCLPPELFVSIEALWNDPLTPRLMDRRSEFYLMDSAEYFFNAIPELSSPSYMPTPNDILHTRLRSTGVTSTRFAIGPLDIHLFDVGGQRNERKKWIHCFEGVTCLIFCVALSEYDQVLLEDGSQNRMVESLLLFESVINSRWFLRTSIILFLNKVDVFKKKLAGGRAPLGKYFKDYDGGDDVSKAAKYVLWRFMGVNKAKLSIYPHLTQATDTSNIRLVFAAVKETVLQNALKDSGIL